MPSYLEMLKPGQCPICEGRKLVHSSGDGWDEWDDCRICKATGVLTPDMVEAETREFHRMEEIYAAAEIREREVGAIMLEIDPGCFGQGSTLERWRAASNAAEAQLAARAAT